MHYPAMLFWAIDKSEHEHVKILVHRRTDADIRDKFFGGGLTTKRTPLEFAAIRGHAGIFKLLCAALSDEEVINARNAVRFPVIGRPLLLALMSYFCCDFRPAVRDDAFSSSCLLSLSRQ